MAKRDSYCMLLGLDPFREETYSAETVSGIIDKKEKKWSEESRNRQNDVGMRFRNQSYLDMVPDMRRVMSDPSLREKEFEEGRVLLTAKASKLRKDSVILHDGTPVRISGTAEILAKRMKWDGIRPEELVKLAGVTDYDFSSVVDDTVSNAFKALQTVDSFTPQEMINSLINNSDLELGIGKLTDSSSFEQIRSAFDLCEKRVNSVRPEILPNQDTYIQSIRAVKMAMRPDEKLSELIEYGMCQRALSPVKDIIEEEYTRPIDRTYIDELLSIYLTNENPETAIRILEDFCIRKKFIANFSDGESRMIRCPECKAFVETGTEIMCCSVCGHTIKMECPRCGTRQSSLNIACVKCGFDIRKGLGKALESEKHVEELAKSGLVIAAEKELSELKAEYSTYEAIISLEKKVGLAKTQLYVGKRKIEQSYSFRRYCEAVDRTKNLLVQFGRFLEEDPATEKIYEESEQRIAEAEALYQKAGKADSRSSRMELYVAAAERCPDHLLVQSLLSEYPPDPPADASVIIKEGKILVKYAVPKDRDGLTFCIYRERYTRPNTEDDDIPLAEVSTGYFLDETAEPGIDYYYTVLSKRWGVLSEEGATCGPAVVYSEVQNVSIDPLEDGLRISFVKPANCSRVRVWRKTADSESDEKELQVTGQEIEDRGLVGGQTYHYLFVAEYDTPDGRIKRSSGTVFSGATSVLPDPVRDLKVSWNKSDGTFTAEWTGDENAELYSSPKSIRMYGTLVKMSDAESWMTKIVPIEKTTGKMRFSLPDGAVQYLYPMIPVGRYAVRGKEVRVAELKPFRDVEKKISGGDCIISMTWPRGTDSAVAVITDSGAPAKGPDDLDGERITVSAEAYSADKTIRIHMGNRTKRTVTLFAVYDVEGKKMASRGMTFDVSAETCRKIRYTIDADHSKKDRTDIRVSMKTPDNVEFVPPIMAVLSPEGIPLRRNDGEVLWMSEVPMLISKGRCVFRFEAKPGTDTEKIRLFFEKDEDYNSFRFVHPLKGRAEL
ncbi:MAG: hypothetical protein ACOX8L_01755 [Candidatus Methanomethylophilaceae archaeon]|jgi:hypothetical protein